MIFVIATSLAYFAICHCRIAITARCTHGA
eukprot:COSAG02_NODE_36214_length_457_cov_1.377095_2_plen_29_part_01